MSRERLLVAILLLTLFAILGCSGGDDGPTTPESVCALPWGGNHTWFMRGGCAGGVASDVSGSSAMTFNSCTITSDVTPPAEKARGATWTLTGNFQTGTAQVVRANTTCPATDTGTFRMSGNSAVADVRSPNNPSCSCDLVYTISIARPL